MRNAHLWLFFSVTTLQMVIGMCQALHHFTCSPIGLGGLSSACVLRVCCVCVACVLRVCCVCAACVLRVCCVCAACVCVCAACVLRVCCVCAACVCVCLRVSACVCACALAGHLTAQFICLRLPCSDSRNVLFPRSDNFCVGGLRFDRDIAGSFFKTWHDP